MSHDGFYHVIFRGERVTVRANRCAVHPSPRGCDLYASDRFLLFEEVLSVGAFICRVGSDVNPISRLRRVVVPVAYVSAFEDRYVPV